MESTDNWHHDEQFLDELKECSAQLVEQLQKKDYENASGVIRSIMDSRDQHLFNSVGQLTRALHSAIVNFNVDTDMTGVNSHADGSDSEIKDASDRLHYVINMTQNAAEKTMDRVEIAAPIAMNLGREAKTLKDEWDRLRRREVSKEEFAQLYARIDEFLLGMTLGADELNENLQAIILEQGFQDLTGQVLKKVIGLVTDVENELVNLMRIAGKIEAVAGISTDKPIDTSLSKKKTVSPCEAEGPQIHAAQRDDVVNGQDDVDDLLSSLGF
ncbi:protein phosphatase CheZ [Marinagarivorans algicola]|uniref:protein phosphatase CheZ n=1 Tax=Marinagarivorans algicola TaxID=1513270 RepID=UPI0006B435B9|nr:protein phosphatase CheZ [Marinagarivorans algicola]